MTLGRGADPRPNLTEGSLIATAATRKRRAVARARRWPHRLAIVVLMLSGAAAFIWPVIQTFANSYQTASVTTQYARFVESTRATEPEQLNTQLDAAHLYNANLAPEILDDPWGATAPGTGERYRAYLAELSGTEAIGRIRIPDISVDLLIYHGADEPSLSIGVGHMYGSSLPVGGAGTHAVLAAHTGRIGHTFFDRLPELDPGAVFYIDVAGTTLTYQVEQILVVEPTALEQVKRVDGEDLVTLVTCYTPPGGEKQRLLVRGVRVPDPPVVEPVAGPAGGSTILETTTVDIATADLSIQGWMRPRLAGGAVALVLLRGMIGSWVIPDRTPKRRRTERDPGSNEAER